MAYPVGRGRMGVAVPLCCRPRGTNSEPTLENCIGDAAASLRKRRIRFSLLNSRRPAATKSTINVLASR